jgi:hypothetical protein
MRYVVIADDADVPTIDHAIDLLLAKRNATGLPIAKVWISEDIDEALERRFKAELEAMV